MITEIKHDCDYMALGQEDIYKNVICLYKLVYSKIRMISSCWLNFAIQMNTVDILFSNKKVLEYFSLSGFIDKSYVTIKNLNELGSKENYIKYACDNSNDNYIEILNKSMVYDKIIINLMNLY